MKLNNVHATDSSQIHKKNSLTIFVRINATPCSVLKILTRKSFVVCSFFQLWKFLHQQAKNESQNDMFL